MSYGPWHLQNVPGIARLRRFCIQWNSRVDGDVLATDTQALAVGSVDASSDEEQSEEEVDDTWEFAVIDGGAGDNLLNFDRDCWGKDYKQDTKQSWGTAKNGVRLRAIGSGTISIIAEASNGKKYAIQLFAYHVPQIAMNLISVYYLCKRGYVARPRSGGWISGLGFVFLKVSPMKFFFRTIIMDG